jgi:L-seryl-tRNA(Ser) seleniumtransferase
MNPPDDNKKSLLRLIPQVNELIEFAERSAATACIPRQVVARATRNVLDATRQKIMEGNDSLFAGDLALESLARTVEIESVLLMRPSLRKVINATGVVLHTNLGRAPVSGAALEAVRRTCEGYCNLEYDIETGERGSRQSHLEDLLCWLSGAEAAVAVNNNAAAVLLVLAALARGRDVIVSRGQLVEIGDSFRLPDIMHQSGARLVEVGTTNRTRISDYANAVGEDTAMIMLIHQSNFRIVGYTEDVPLSELVALGKQHFIPVVEDMGSGCLLDLDAIGLGGEHTVGASIEDGADLVTFSGDKLLGGPQAGIIVGSREYVDSVRKHPLARALRVDKMTVAALEATLRAYLEPRAAWAEIPALRMLSEPPESVKARANRLKRSIDKARCSTISCVVIPEMSRAGGGSLPTAEIPTFCVQVTHSSLTAEQLEQGLRCGDPAVLPRVRGDSVLLDLRTVSDREVRALASAVSSLG